MASYAAPGDYRKDVLKLFMGPHSAELSRAIQELKGGAKAPSKLDLPLLYGISDGMGEAQRRERIEWVRDAWAKSVNNSRYKDVATRVRQLDELLRTKNAHLESDQFWGECFRATREASREQRQRLIELIKREFAVLGVVTTKDVNSIADSIGLGVLTADDLAEVVDASGLALVEEFDLPETVLPPGIKELQRSTCRSLVDVILDAEPQDFCIVDGFKASGYPALSLTLVRQRQTDNEKKPHSPENAAIKKVLGVLAAQTSDRELHALTLRHLIALAEEAANGGAVSLGVMKLRDVGVHPIDAGRIARQIGGTSHSSRLGDVEQLLLSGQLIDARRRLVEIKGVAGTESPELNKMEQRLVDLEVRVVELKQRAETAVSRHDIATATGALQEALGIAADDPSLEEQLRRLPPAAPIQVEASAVRGSDNVRILWSPGYGVTDDTRYVVVRRDGKPPMDPRDGEVLATGLSETEWIDKNPIVGRTAWYGVAAGRGGTPSRIATTELDHLPPVMDLACDTTETEVALRWRRPKGASDVDVVVMGPGYGRKKIAVQGDRTSAGGLTTGASYRFDVSAVFRTPTGELRRSAPQVVDAVPRSRAKPLAAFSVNPRLGVDKEQEVRASWRPPPMHQIEVWYLSRPPQWTYGSVVALSELSALGTRLSGRLEQGGSRATLTGPAPTGLSYFVPFTVDGDKRVVGQAQELGVCPPVTRALAERFGEEILVSFDWPTDDFDVSVEWSFAGGTGKRTLSLEEYRQHGGVRFSVGTGPTSITLRTVVRGESGWTSSDVSLDVPGAPMKVRYELRWRRGFHSSTRVTCTFKSDESLRAAILIGASPGRYLPSDRSRYETLREVTLDHTAESRETTIEIEVDRKRMGKDYWIRAFAENPDYLFVDDPRSDLLRGR